MAVGVEEEPRRLRKHRQDIFDLWQHGRQPLQHPARRLGEDRHPHALASRSSSFTARGVTVSTIKHAHHDFDVDKPGKDSYEHRNAGATEVLVASGNRWALMHELRGARFQISTVIR